GERTNLLEENFEEPWQRRQKFKVDWETNSLDPIANIAWFYADFSHECATLISQNLVPSTFEFDQAQQALNLVIEANYDLTVDGGCYDMVSLAHDVGTATIQYRLSFYRPQAGDYKAEEIKEKDTVNKKYGSFQVLNTFRDPETGLLSARSLLQRWNPDRTEPVTYYFHKGFPERFKPMFKEIEADTNKVMQEAGAQVRFRFAEYNEGGIERNLGDIRYSFVTWHQDIDSTRGLLGYGPSSPDPRTGEVISANVNLYNVGMDYYRFLIEDYLINNGAKGKPAGSENTPWEKISCTEGETVAPETETDRLQSGLFNEMRRVMELPEEPTADVRSLFIPEPARKDTFMDD
ncbi:MAG: hypothetical protein MUF54_16820, partial [Polyangiaceae bacterium]|nr:hypothetical protein [Polyangiaceae bacterium]